MFIFAAMNVPKRLFFTVTNDLNYDQRMHRICTTLSDAGYDVTLVGRVLPTSLPTKERPFRQIRLRCWRHKGFAFYAEFNVRLLFFLWKNDFDAVCSIDLDTLPAGCMATLTKGKPRVFDAHEYFTEVPEVTHRPLVKLFWSGVERLFLPFYRHAYTVGPALARIFSQQHGIAFRVVRNVPFPQTATTTARTEPGKKILLYQGALNEGRGLETLIDAVPLLPPHIELWLAGEGDLSQTLRTRAQNAGERVRFLGFVDPETLKEITREAWLGLNLLENKGLSYYYSLANKFFDYVQTNVPIITMNFPEYAALNQQHEVAILLDNLDVATLAKTIVDLDNHPDQYLFLQKNCQKAALEWHWEKEKQTLLEVYEQVMRDEI
jgi:glycosyltransferase involved in cell wall biosynthesis